MDSVNIHDAKTRLSELIAKVERGEHIIIARAGKPVAQLTAYRQEPLPRREPGGWEGQAWRSADFDASDAEIARMLNDSTLFPPKR